ncbi:MAG: hypothetical protein QXF04_03535 [Candidatus Aenigmatarchaeota archaeon]|nr:hypothetical protein [Candidatus Aenigmarchaeota archaeon]
MKLLSEFVSKILVLLISITAISIALLFLNPIIDRNLNSISIQEAISNMKKIEAISKEVLSEAIGSQRVLEIRIHRGILYVSNNSFVYILESDNIPLEDFTRRDGNLLIEKIGNTFSITLNFEYANIIGNIYLSSGNHRICILKNAELTIKVYIC